MKDKLITEPKFKLRHFTTTKACGNMKDDSERKLFMDSLNLDDGRLVLARQVHGNKVQTVNSSDGGRFIEECDGLITSDKNVMLGIFTADCMPVFMASKDGRVKAAVHAGWKGLAGGILGNALDLFEKEFAIMPGDVEVYIAPHIKGCCYEVGKEFEGIFGAALTDNKIDLSAAAEKMLIKRGVNDVLISGHCTFHENDLFFSYRKDKTEKRLISFCLG